MIEYLVVFAIVSVCLLLIVIILLQKGRGGGLSAALGGGSSGSAFGSKTGDVFTWITVTLAGLYLILNVVGNLVFRQTVEAPTTIVSPLSIEGESVPDGGNRQSIQFGDVLEIGEIEKSNSPIKLNVSPVAPSTDEGSADGDADAKESPVGQDDDGGESDEPKPVQDPPADDTADPAPAEEPDEAAPAPDGN